MPRKVNSISELADAELEKLARQELRKRGLDEELAANVKSIRISDWQGFIKNADGEAEYVPQAGASIVLTPSWDEGPEWPVVQQAAPVKITPNKPKATTADGWKTAVILPDPQIGYRQTDDGKVDPFHDEKAIDVALQILAAARKADHVDVVVNLGDFLDLPAQGKYAQEAGFARMTQLGVDYGHQFLARQRAICPEADIHVIEGNHDKRLGDYVTRNAMAAFGLRRAGDPPAKWPTLSIPYLLRVEELDVQWHEGYPASGVWLNDHIECIHGIKVRSSGSTASAVINDSRHSIIFGHVHRIEVQHKTDRTRTRAYRKFAATPGCLCRVDGAVPSFYSSIKRDGNPVTYYENWQQGVLIVKYRDDSDQYCLEMVEINDGVAVWRGKEYRAE